ncbi:hypothetical protein CPB86DRAFT_852104 [Serendipita vermifera]|nr:hypothetical protein CPB86DRAFT_852104 [Serendipita vermifera]
MDSDRLSSTRSQYGGTRCYQGSTPVKWGFPSLGAELAWVGEWVAKVPLDPEGTDEGMGAQKRGAGAGWQRPAVDNPQALRTCKLSTRNFNLHLLTQNLVGKCEGDACGSARSPPPHVLVDVSMVYYEPIHAFTDLIYLWLHNIHPFSKYHVAASVRSPSEPSAATTDSRDSIQFTV